jgi:uncharacterized membrane protein YphA (DoxX/SURF4 family)
MIEYVSGLYRRLDPAFGCAQAGFLLAVRLYWGIQFAQHGWGKLTHLNRTGHFFASLNLPVPQRPRYSSHLSSSLEASCSP